MVAKFDGLDSLAASPAENRYLEDLEEIFEEFALTSPFKRISQKTVFF